MSWSVEFTAAAARQLRELDRPVRVRLIAAINGLAEPRPAGATKLVGEETAWRNRVGDFRVIYDVLDEALVVTVVGAGHRREVTAARPSPPVARQGEQPLQPRGLNDPAQRQTSSGAELV